MINKRLINLCGESKKYILLTVMTNWLATVCNILTVLLLGKIINGVFNQINGVALPTELGGIPYHREYLIIGILLIIRFISNIVSTHFSHRASSKAKVKLRNMIYDKLLRLGLNYNDNTSTSSILQMSIEGVEALEIYFGRYLPQFFYALLAPITLFIVFSFISLKTAIVFILCVPLIPLSIIAIMKIAKRILKNYWNTYSNLGESFLDNLQGLTTLKIFNIDESVHRKMNDEAEGFRKITMKVLSMQLNSITIMDLIAFGGSALGSIVALNQYLIGNINLGQTLIIILLSSEFFIPLRLLGSFFHVAMNGIAAADKIFVLLDTKEREKLKATSTSIDEAAVARFDGTETTGLNILIDHINFSYDGKKEVIKGVSMEIPAKSFIAIVGESGSGKSTIASLLLNNYEVEEGEISFNGVNINQINNEKLYNKLALIATNSYIFNGTILDNFLMAKPDATVEEIETALQLTNLSGFVKSLEDGLNTKVGEGGSLLSGGQKQRLALARAILTNREVFIFDEATSNIDVESEEVIWDSIGKLSKEKTTIVISHRLANVIGADGIYVMDNGRVIEFGNHKELMALKGKYYNMINEQSMLEGRKME
ncbi:ABC transporter ATP-binding protein/permease [Alkaliphilus transvaalensis]|uniref:ABC transporter ATP-binding protein/permease n=1 Tax=Alkaliphilus transvaalensis TaxID=114628 RepID=UPI002E8E105B|nr:ABC transporter ATP-binding protein/permease [Alkaliphilus transvaalensis]